LGFYSLVFWKPGFLIGLLGLNYPGCSSFHDLPPKKASILNLRVWGINSGQDLGAYCFFNPDVWGKKVPFPRGYGETGRNLRGGPFKRFWGLHKLFPHRRFFKEIFKGPFINRRGSLFPITGQRGGKFLILFPERAVVYIPGKEVII